MSSRLGGGNRGRSKRHGDREENTRNKHQSSDCPLAVQAVDKDWNKQEGRHNENGQEAVKNEEAPNLQYRRARDSQNRQSHERDGGAPSYVLDEGQRCDRVAGDKRQKYEIVVPPRYAETLTGEEGAKRCEHHTDGVLYGVLGHTGKRLPHDEAHRDNGNERKKCPGRSRLQTVQSTEGNHDKDNLETLKENTPKGGAERMAVRHKVAAGFLVHAALIVHCLQAARAQNRLVQPGKSEKKQAHSNQGSNKRDGYVRSNRRTKDEDESYQDQHCCSGCKKGSTPTLEHAHRKHDGECLDPLNPCCEECNQ